MRQRREQSQGSLKKDSSSAVQANSTAAGYYFNVAVFYILFHALSTRKIDKTSSRSSIDMRVGFPVFHLPLCSLFDLRNGIQSFSII